MPEHEGLRAVISRIGVDKLVISDFTTADLVSVGSPGSREHIAVATELERVATGEVEYLAVRAPDGSWAAKGAINYVWHPGSGSIFQVSTRIPLRRLGIGTRLMVAAEARIRERGCTMARLAVSRKNMRARALYERLGYVAVGDRAASWTEHRKNGSAYVHEAILTDMEKRISRSSSRLR